MAASDLVFSRQNFYYRIASQVPRNELEIYTLWRRSQKNSHRSRERSYSSEELISNFFMFELISIPFRTYSAFTIIVAFSSALLFCFYGKETFSVIFQRGIFLTSWQLLIRKICFIIFWTFEKCKTNYGFKLSCDQSFLMIN